MTSKKMLERVDHRSRNLKSSPNTLAGGWGEVCAPSSPLPAESRVFAKALSSVPVSSQDETQLAPSAQACEASVTCCQRPTEITSFLVQPAPAGHVVLRALVNRQRPKNKSGDTAGRSGRRMAILRMQPSAIPPTPDSRHPPAVTTDGVPAEV